METKKHIKRRATASFVDENARLTPVRRANLVLLTSPDGAVSRLAAAMGLTSGAVSAVKTRVDKSIGRLFCSNVERALGFPDGWMNTPHVASDVPDAVTELLNRSARGSRALRARVEDQDSAVNEEIAMDEKDIRTVECLTFLRSASAAMESARSASARSNLPSDIKDQILALSRQVDGFVTKVWNTIGNNDE